MIYHVSVSGSDDAAGTKEAPFRTINRAAAIARPGDTVRVYSGEYREWVDPQFGGTCDKSRIVYEAAPGEHPVIKGSEIITDWEHVEDSIWKKVLPNTMFGDWNPYKEIIFGDWMRYPEEYDAHYGDVYINGVSMFEASSMEDLYKAPVRHEYMKPTISAGVPEYILHPELTIYRYLAQVTSETTTLLCNFQEIDPNAELIEINVRKCCFYPKHIGINYITVRGFEIAHAACPFAPPTAEQFGMVGPHWSKGWIIENNHLHDAKCSGISLGKKFSDGDNLASHLNQKSGHRHHLEAVCFELRDGWSKEKVGSHIVRNNVIHDCGQNGIVGHMGCAFSRIEHNHIYNISVKREFWGHELGGIKFHAPIDTVIAHNNIHNCTIGTWLDWQAQGTRVTGNLYHGNYRDFMVEVSHGPLVVDNNILLSDFAMDNHAQGSAFVHNIITGVMRPRPMLKRDTPYHFPHSTQLKGFCPTMSGDDRYLNNMVMGLLPQRGELPKITGNLGSVYDHYSTPEEYPARIKASGRGFYQETYTAVPQPVWFESNAYAGYAKPFRGEKNPIITDGMQAKLEESGGKWILTVAVPESVANASCREVTTSRLGAPRTSDAPFDDYEGKPIDFSVDYLGNHRTGNVIPGPFASLKTGTQSIVVWEK